MTLRVSSSQQLSSSGPRLAAIQKLCNQTKGTKGVLLSTAIRCHDILVAFRFEVHKLSRHVDMVVSPLQHM